MSVATVATARLLSLGLAPPDRESLAEMGALALGLLEHEDPAPELTELVALLASDGEALASEHEALFGRQAAVPPYETSYERDPFRSGRELADVAGFYRAFGAEPAGDRADHVAAELEFFAFLVAKRLSAGDPDHELTCLAAEDAFLRDHLGRFLPGLCARLGETASPLYSCLGRLGARFAAEELAGRGLEPAPLGTGAAAPVEDDALACG